MTRGACSSSPSAPVPKSPRATSELSTSFVNTQRAATDPMTTATELPSFLTEGPTDNSEKQVTSIETPSIVIEVPTSTNEPKVPLLKGLFIVVEVPTDGVEQSSSSTEALLTAEIEQQLNFTKPPIPSTLEQAVALTEPLITYKELILIAR